MQLSIATALTTIFLLLNLTNSYAGIGKVTEQTGPTEILRDKKSISSQLNTSVEMNDVVTTARAKAELTFEDATKVKITEQSKLVIDDFVYDPKKGSGKLQRVALSKPLTKFTLGSIDTAPAEMSIQVAPWIREYPSPVLWHLNQAWSLGSAGILSEDIQASTPPGTTTRKELAFKYNKAAGTIDWGDDTIVGQVAINRHALGWYLILKQKDTNTKTAALSVDGVAVVEI